MEAWFCAQALWRIISNVSKPPTVSSTPKEGEEDKLEVWQLKADKGAGIMWLMVDNTQRVHMAEGHKVTGDQANPTFELGNGVGIRSCKSYLLSLLFLYVLSAIFILISILCIPITTRPLILNSQKLKEPRMSLFTRSDRY